MSTKQAVIIVAGGKGERMQTAVPKQFLLINKLPVLMHTIHRFHDFFPQAEIILVLPAPQTDYWKKLCADFHFEINHLLAEGGSTRFESVLNGLSVVKPDVELIAVHDGVRPLVSHETISRCFEAALRDGAAIPVTDPVESIREITYNGSVAVDRSRYKLVQTPQVFKADILRKAYRQAYIPQFTDDASVVEATGHKITLVEGNRENIKITTAVDLKLAELYMSDK